MAMDIFTEANADSTDGCSPDIDAKADGGLHAQGALQKFIRVVDRVGMRKQVAQPKPDFTIIRILRQGRRVVRAPVTNRAAFELERHFHGVPPNLIPAFCTSRYGKSQINDSS